MFGLESSTPTSTVAREENYRIALPRIPERQHAAASGLVSVSVSSPHAGYKSMRCWLSNAPQRQLHTKITVISVPHLINISYHRYHYFIPGSFTCLLLFLRVVLLLYVRVYLRLVYYNNLSMAHMCVVCRINCSYFFAVKFAKKSAKRQPTERIELSTYTLRRCRYYH